MYVVADERGRRKESHLLLEGESTSSPDVYINLVTPICTFFFFNKYSLDILIQSINSINH